MAKDAKGLEFPQERKRTFLLVLFLVALAIRAGWGISRAEEIAFPDEKAYLEIATNFLAGKGFVTDGGSVATRTPLYPLFLAAVIKFFGRNYLAVRLFQALLGAFLPLLVYFLAKTYFRENEARFAGAVAAIYPFFIFYTGLLLSETLFLSLFLLALFLLRRAFQKGNVSLALSGGLVMGLASLVRPSAFLFLPFAVPFWLLFARKKLRAAKSVAVALLAFFIILFPWALRNRLLTGHFVWTTLESGRSLYESLGPEATGGPAMHLVHWPEDTRSMSEFETDRYLRNLAISYALKNPRRTLKLSLVKFCRIYAPIPNAKAYRRPPYVLVSLVSYLPLLAIGFAGLWREGRRLRSLWLLALPILYFTLLHCVFVGSIRYRAAFMPSLIIFAGAFLFSRRH